MPQISPDELRRYLQGVDPDVANEIRTRYAEAVATQDAATWSRDKTYAWLEEQVSTMSGDTVPNPTAASSVLTATEAAAERARAAADRAGQQADERASRVRTSYTDSMAGYGMDRGPVFDPEAIATSLAVGSWVDESGQPIDPYSGQPVDEPIAADSAVLWDLIRGQTFNMGSLAPPGYKERRWEGYRPLRRGFTGTEPGVQDNKPHEFGYGSVPGLNFNRHLPEQTKMLTPSQAMALLGSMDESYLLSLQQQMWDAGLYAMVGEGVRPEWGKADPFTRSAFQKLFLEASTDPDTPISQVLAQMAERNIRGLADVPGAPGSSSGQAPDFTPEVASEETLSALVDEMAQNLLGKYIPDEQKADLIKRLQEREIGTQRQRYQQDLDQFNQGGGSGGGGVPGMEDIDVFMQAISGLESGGNYEAQNPGGAHGKYQIMPSNWRPWAERAGLGPNAPQTPENQEIVAKRIMMDYFAQFGNWRDVAIAWFAGPGAVGAAGAENRSDGNITVREYADRIMDSMASLRAGTGGPAGQAGGTQYPAIERFDPAAEAEAIIKGQDPAGWVGHQFANRAVEFYNLLGGVV